MLNHLRQPRPSFPQPAGTIPKSARPSLWVACALLGLIAGTSVHAQLGTPGAFLSRSVSGQFIIQSTPASIASPLAGVLENDTNFVRLDATLLTVSCERIKQILWGELHTTAPWCGKIFVRLYPARSGEDPISIDAEDFRDGWQYRVTLPGLVQRERYVRAMVEVVLLELANRNARGHTAEIPTWLTEGLSRQLLASSQREIILRAPQVSDAGLRMTTLLVNAQRQNPLEQAHQELCASTPLTFQQLSWPSPDYLTGDIGELYRSSAQLFVHQLLSLSDGPACLRSMLENLAQYYNWQFAFLRAFNATFQRPLDVEKWWSLQLVHFTGRGLAETWAAAESWQKLDELVRSAVQIRIGTNELPLRAEVTLQTIIRDWEPPRQTQVLESKLRELQMLRARLAADLAPLVDEYCRTIETYVQNMNHTGFVLPFRKHAALRRNATETLRRLDELDARRTNLRPVPKVPETIQASSPPALSP